MADADPNDRAKRELGARDDAASLLASFRAFLASPAYANDVDLAVLTSLAADKSVPARERLRAAEMLLRYRLKAMETLAQLEGVREQVLRDLGTEAAPQLALTQVNQQIEIVRADDWRGAKAIEAQATVADEVAPKHLTNGHGSNGEA